MTEEWRTIEGFEGFYEVSNLGRIRSLDRMRPGKNGCLQIRRGQIIKPHKMPNGYLNICLHGEGKKKRAAGVHRLVAEAFLERRPDQTYVNHLDNDKTNNEAKNLEWCTQAHNIQYAYDNGTKVPPHRKKVLQLDEEGNVLKVWESIAAANRGCGCWNIQKAVTGEREHAGGYRWRMA